MLLALDEAVQPAIDAPAHGRDVAAVSQRVEIVLVPEPAGRIGGMEGLEQQVGVGLGFGRIGAVVGAAGELDQPPAPVFPAVAGALVAIAQAVGIDVVGDGLGFPGVVLGQALVEVAREDPAQALDGIVEVLRHPAKALALMGAVGQEACLALWRGDVVLHHGVVQRVAPAQRHVIGGEPGFGDLFCCDFEHGDEVIASMLDKENQLFAKPGPG